MIEEMAKITWNVKSADGLESITIRTDDKEEAQVLSQWANGQLHTGKPFPDDKGAIAHTEETTTTTAPVCPDHKKVMVQRQGQYGKFWSCGSKNVDGTWCKYKPNKEGATA